MNGRARHGKAGSTVAISLSLVLVLGIAVWVLHKYAFTMRTYIHASDDDLRQGHPALARIHKIALLL